jgi:hypothetical protein
MQDNFHRHLARPLSRPGINAAMRYVKRETGSDGCRLQGANSGEAGYIALA